MLGCWRAKPRGVGRVETRVTIFIVGVVEWNFVVVVDERICLETFERLTEVHFFVGLFEKKVQKGEI